MSLDKKRTTQRIDFLTSSARIASGNSSEFDVERFSEAIIMLEISAIGGTPTLDIVIQVYDELAGQWQNHTSFAQKTALGRDNKQITNFGRRMRINYTIGGTTPSFTFSVSGLFKS